MNVLWMAQTLLICLFREDLTLTIIPFTISLYVFVLSKKYHWLSYHDPSVLIFLSWNFRTLTSKLATDLQGAARSTRCRPPIGKSQPWASTLTVTRTLTTSRGSLKRPLERCLEDRQIWPRRTDSPELLRADSALLGQLFSPILRWTAETELDSPASPEATSSIGNRWWTSDLSQWSSARPPRTTSAQSGTGARKVNRRRFPEFHSSNFLRPWSRGGRSVRPGPTALHCCRMKRPPVNRVIAAAKKKLAPMPLDRAWRGWVD